MRFVAAPEYPVFPTRERPLQPYEAVVRATAETRPRGRRARARRRRPRHPHARPRDGGRARGSARSRRSSPTCTRSERPGFPPMRSARGSREPAAGRRVWRTFDRAVEAGLRQGRTQLNETRRRLGPPTGDTAARRDQRPALHRRHVSPARVSARLAGRASTSSGRCSGSRRSRTSSRRRATSRWCSSRPRPRRTPSTGCSARPSPASAASRSGCSRPGTASRSPEPLFAAENTRLVEWVSYSRTMPRSALVICHAGHGTMVRALASGCPVLAVPALGRHGRERRPGGLGGGRASGSRGGCLRRRRCGWRRGGRSSDADDRRARGPARRVGGRARRRGARRGPGRAAGARRAAAAGASSGGPVRLDELDELGVRRSAPCPSARPSSCRGRRPHGSAVISTGCHTAPPCSQSSSSATVPSRIDSPQLTAADRLPWRAGAGFACAHSTISSRPLDHGRRRRSRAPGPSSCRSAA